MGEPTFLSRDIDYLGELGAHLRGLTGYRTLAHELIQNADDVEGADEMSFDVRSDAFVVDNNGRFSECDDVTSDECHWKTEGGRRCDFHRFRRIAAGDKRGEAGTTGAFGIGFISVYQVTDHPEVLSAGRHWRIHEDRPPANRIEVCPGCEACQRALLPGTRFVLPWAFDPVSVLRARLQVAEVGSTAPRALLEELKRALSGAMLFLKRLKTFNLRDNGKLVRRYERVDDGQNIILSDGEPENDTVWHILTGGFVAEAAALRAAQPGRIEEKRRADVALAIGACSSQGLLWACLPTEHSLGLPFHVNADFFPTVDRKRILFDQDYQAQWNRSALTGAAQALATHVEALTRLLGPVQFWTMVKAIKDASDQATGDSEARVFWSALAARLRSVPTVFTTRHEWTLPAKTFLLQAPEEARSIGILEELGFQLVDESLRPFQTLIREAIGVPVFEVSDLAQALIAMGFNRRRELSETDVPMRLRSSEGWSTLWAEVGILLTRKQSHPRARAADEELLRSLAIAPGSDGAMWPCRDLYAADGVTTSLFDRLGVGVNVVANAPAFAALGNLCPIFNVSHAIMAISGRESSLEERWRNDPSLIADTFAWLEDRRGEIVPTLAIKQRVGELRLFPSSNTLKTLQDLALPGGFNDPIGLADLVDVNTLGGRREFLVDLGMKELDFNTYVAVRVPAKLKEAVLAPEKLRELLQLLSIHLGEFRDDQKARKALSEVSLAEGTDDHFHVPAKSYFDTTAVRECLAGQFPIVRLPQEHASAVREFLGWLGVEAVPRLSDVCTVIRTVVAGPYSAERCTRIRTLFAHLTTRLRPGDSPSDLLPLTMLSWLPARGQTDRWYKAGELYASYQGYLFESDGTFLDVAPAIQNAGRPLIDFLGVHATPETVRVVKHLLNCVARNVAVNAEVYRFLNDKAAEPAVTLLGGKPCLWIDDAYRSPQEVFWQPHPFGTYRTRLSQGFVVYRALLDQIEVREAPLASDAVAVIREISATFGTSNLPLDDGAQSVVMACWQFLDRDFDDTDLPPGPVTDLRDVKSVPNADRLLMPPVWMFFENRAGLAAKFEGFLAANVIPRPIGSSRAMAAAGVRSLGSAVQLVILEGGDPVDDSDTADRLRARRHSIARVLEAQSSGRAFRDALARLDEIVCLRSQSLKIRYRLQAFGRDVDSKPEQVPALFNPLTLTLTVVPAATKMPWAAVARELATALLPEEDPGRFAAGLKEVLTAEDDAAAGGALDELGFARLQAEASPPPTAEEATGVLGQETPPPDDVEPPTGEVSGNDVPSEDPEGGTREDPEKTSTNGGEEHGGHKGARKRPRGRQRQEIWRSYVVPADPTADPPDEASDEAHQQRLAVDKAGIARVLEFERQAKRHPIEKSHSNEGYDVESSDDQGTIVRYIEVKSLSGAWNGTYAVLSRPQFDRANASDDEFWLYVVERSMDNDFRIHRIPNPAANANKFMFDDGWRALGEEPEYPGRDTDS